jgi:hypothetical protein
MSNGRLGGIPESLHPRYGFPERWDELVKSVVAETGDHSEFHPEALGRASLDELADGIEREKFVIPAVDGQDRRARVFDDDAFGRHPGDGDGRREELGVLEGEIPGADGPHAITRDDDSPGIDQKVLLNCLQERYDRPLARRVGPAFARAIRSDQDGVEFAEGGKHEAGQIAFSIVGRDLASVVESNDKGTWVF